MQAVAAAAIAACSLEFDTYTGVARTWDNFESSAQEMQFQLKPGAQSMGITLSTVSQQVREAFFGREVQRLPRNGEDVRVVVRYPKEARESIDTLRNLRIRTATGVEVPLFEVADVTFAPGVLEENFLPEWNIRFPDAERILVGQDEEQKRQFRELIIYGLGVLVVMYMMLAIAFKSYFQPFLILVAIPFAYVGMVAGAIVTGIPISIMSIFGFFAAAGVAINDNLVLIDYVNRFLVPAMFAMGVDVGRVFKGLWTGEKQPPLGSTYDPNITLALDELELDDAGSELFSAFAVTRRLPACCR